MNDSDGIHNDGMAHHHNNNDPQATERETKDSSTRFQVWSLLKEDSTCVWNNYQNDQVLDI